jgi:hypothetical protein
MGVDFARMVMPNPEILIDARFYQICRSVVRVNHYSIHQKSCLGNSENNYRTMKALAFLLGFAASVAAHGYVDNGTIGGTYYQVTMDTSAAAWLQVGNTNTLSSTNVSRLEPYIFSCGIRVSVINNDKPTRTRTTRHLSVKLPSDPCI